MRWLGPIAMLFQQETNYYSIFADSGVVAKEEREIHQS